MSNIALRPDSKESLPLIWQKSLKTSPYLSWLAIGSIILFAFTIALNIIDSRVVTRRSSLDKANEVCHFDHALFSNLDLDVGLYRR